MSKQMFTPEEHAARLPGWKKWAAERGVCIPPAFLYNYVPTAVINHSHDAVTAARERCAKIAACVAEKKAAVLAERERCLKYCAQWEASARLNLCVNAVGVAGAIASDIRSGE